MKSSDLKYKIKIYEQILQDTEFGRSITKYRYKCSTRARVNYLSGTKTTDNEAIFYTVDREFIVRSYVPIEYTDVIEYDNDKWQVLSIDRIHEFNDIVIRTTRLNDNFTLDDGPHIKKSN